jgi:hypothetical protein
MLKTILISSLAAILVIAIGFSAYNVLAGAQVDSNTARLAQGAAQAPATQAGAPNGQGAKTQNTPQSTPQAYGAANPAASQQGQGQGAGNRRGQGGAKGGAGAAQNGMTSLVTYTGTVSAYASSTFTLQTADGQLFQVQLGNQSYVASLGLNLVDGETVTVTGFFDSSGALAVTSLTVQSTGQTYTLRDGASGRPSWAGGRSH